MLRRGLMVFFAGSLLALAGCRSAPIMNVNDAPIAGTKSIHKNYNGWIQNLDRAILVRLGS